jgi:hypothetical protein
VPTSANEWIMEWWQRGLFAKAAVDGFRLGTRNGVYEIEKIIQKITAKE